MHLEPTTLKPPGHFVTEKGYLPPKTSDDHMTTERPQPLGHFILQREKPTTTAPPRNNSKFSDDPRVSHRITDRYLPPEMGTKTLY